MKESTLKALQALQLKRQKARDHAGVDENLIMLDFYCDEIPRIKERLDEVHQAILDGQIYAHVESVSKSGMSRRILFYWPRMNSNGQVYIDRVTPVIGWLTGWVKMGEYKQRGKAITEAGLYVGGCGMDMIFHTLYTCLGYEEHGQYWDQHYNML